MTEFNTDVYADEDVAKVTKSVNEYERRNFTNLIRYFLDMPTEPRICIIYGFQGTGKTTAIFQAIQDMTEDERKKAVYIQVKPDNTIDNLGKDLDILCDMGKKIIFVDEITAIKDFIDSSSLLSDIYAAMGMKIIVTGDDSFSFSLAENDQLYDRAYEIHTTPMPIEEYARIIGKNDIDEYIKYGGLLGEKSEYENAIQDYVDKAVIKNM
nr:AAA family ATPase [Bacillota bacterium]